MANKVICDICNNEIDLEEIQYDELNPLSYICIYCSNDTCQHDRICD